MTIRTSTAHKLTWPSCPYKIGSRILYFFCIYLLVDFYQDIS